MEEHEDASDIFYMGAQTQWLPAEHFNNIDNWDDSLKSSASYYIKQAEEWIASEEERARQEFARKVHHTRTSSVKVEDDSGITPVTDSIAIDAVKPNGSQKPYACIQCGKAFNRKTTLTNHLRTHSNEKPYACSQCGKAFAAKGSLVRHHRMHSGEKPFVCSECGRKFARGDHLNNHIRMHSGDKPFTCSQCGKTFSRRDKFNNHTRKHC